MKQSIFNQAASVFICTLLAIVVINFFGSLFIVNELRLFIVFDILLALLVTFFYCFRNLYKRIAELEQRIETLEYQMKKR